MPPSPLRDCLAEIVNVIVSVKQDTGLDGLVVKQLDDHQYAVHGIQIKLGEHHRTITAGKLELQRKRASGAMGGGVDDSTIAGIAAKAERGMVNALALLGAAFGGVTFLPTSVCLLTNKCVTEEGMDLADAPCVRVRPDVELPLNVCHGASFYEYFPLPMRASLVHEMR